MLPSKHNFPSSPRAGPPPRRAWGGCSRPRGGTCTLQEHLVPEAESHGLPSLCPGHGSYRPARRRAGPTSSRPGVSRRRLHPPG
ncbi:hypothetical protein DB31_1092 [Hyalangium minutum]|uniref:Uncharacterized protein n=1 Tax=Hyalangium minutum TaxID=394096 RepID=A0A085WEB4_9BACT|nr:hypothetical protein DB31_1092 [Hyalangium minutum]